MTDPNSKDQTAPEDSGAVSRVPPPAPGGTMPPRRPEPPAPRREAPSRPPLTNPNAAPVVAKVPPPASIRLTQLFWILSFALGGFCVVYLFIIRKAQLPIMEEVIRGVVEGRADETYTAAADILFWTVFGAIVSILIVQIALLVSFMSRRPGVRWWQFATLVLQVILLAISLELVATSGDGQVLRQLLPLQAILVLLALLVSTLPAGLRWTARGVDVRRGPVGSEGSEM